MGGISIADGDYWVASYDGIRTLTAAIDILADGAVLDVDSGIIIRIFS